MCAMKGFVKAVCANKCFMFVTDASGKDYYCHFDSAAKHSPNGHVGCVFTEGTPVLFEPSETSQGKPGAAYISITSANGVLTNKVLIHGKQSTWKYFFKVKKHRE